MYFERVKRLGRTFCSALFSGACRAMTLLWFYVYNEGKNPMICAAALLHDPKSYGKKLFWNCGRLGGHMCLFRAHERR